MVDVQRWLVFVHGANQCPLRFWGAGGLHYESECFLQVCFLHHDQVRHNNVQAFGDSNVGSVASIGGAAVNNGQWFLRVPDGESCSVREAAADRLRVPFGIHNLGHTDEFHELLFVRLECAIGQVDLAKRHG